MYSVCVLCSYHSSKLCSINEAFAMMMWVLRHLVTQPVSEFQTDLRAEFFRVLWKVVTEWERSSNREKVFEQWKMYKCEFLRKTDISICAIHRINGATTHLWSTDYFKKLSSHPEGQWWMRCHIGMLVAFP